MATIAFDLDGTLLDSRTRHRIVMDDVLRIFDISLDTSNLIPFKRDGKNNIAFLTTNGIDSDTATKIQREWISRIEAPEYLIHDILYPDAIELLESWARDNNLILITSRSNASATQQQISDLDLNKYFSDIYIVPVGADAAGAKAKILADTGANVMIGDTSVDYRAACIAGIDFIFHENGFHTKETVMRKHKKWQMY